MKEIRIAIIGTGVIAHQHLECYKNISGVKVVAACDLISKKLDDFCEQYDIKDKYINFREMIARDDIDAVDVCVHNNLHTPISVEVMRAGKHCYCEKPLAGSYKDAKTIVDTANELGKMLHMQVSSLYTPQCRAAERFISGGKLGEIYHARSYGFRRRGRPFVDGYAEKEFNSKYWAAGGALYDMGVYHISLMLHLLGLPEVSRISGAVYQKLDMDATRKAEGGFDVEEMGCGFVKFKGDLTLDILESWAINAGSFPPCMIAGDKGGLQIKPFSDDAEALQYFNECEGYPVATTVDTVSEEYRMHQLHPEYAHNDNSVTRWVAALRGEMPAPTTGKLGLATMLVSNGIFISSQLGHEVSAQEVIEQSVSVAIREQETPFGILKYDF